MTRVVLLDTGPLGLITHPKASPQSDQCNQWMQSQLTKGTRVLVPGISDYELRREMLRMGSIKGIAKLDALRNAIGFVPITTAVMDQAAMFWAQARKMGKPTASDAALDGDMILAGHSTLIGREGHDVIIATANVKHIELFCVASLWADIK
jgi:predicted nucleic acid-binding protein